MPSPSQSLLMHVDEEGEPGDKVDLGVRVATLTGGPLVPGSAHDAELTFWSDIADLYVIPGRRFTLRYPTRVVGHGQVLEVLPF